MMIVRAVSCNEFVDVPRFGSADDDDIAAEKGMLTALPRASNGDSLHKNSTSAAEIDDNKPVSAPFDLKVLSGDIQRVRRIDQV